MASLKRKKFTVNKKRQKNNLLNILCDWISLFDALPKGQNHISVSEMDSWNNVNESIFVKYIVRNVRNSSVSCDPKDIY